MKATSSGVKFDSLDEAVSSLTREGYMVYEIVKGLIYTVTPADVSKDNFVMISQSQPAPVAILYGGTDLAYRNGSNPEVIRHHNILKQIYSGARID